MIKCNLVILESPGSVFPGWDKKQTEKELNLDGLKNLVRMVLKSALIYSDTGNITDNKYRLKFSSEFFMTSVSVRGSLLRMEAWEDQVQ